MNKRLIAKSIPHFFSISSLLSLAIVIYISSESYIIYTSFFLIIFSFICIKYKMFNNIRLYDSYFEINKNRLNYQDTRNSVYVVFRLLVLTSRIESKTYISYLWIVDKNFKLNKIFK